MTRIAIGFLHRGGRALLGKRAPTMRMYPEKWEGAGGHVEDGESASAAVRRELREEIGVEVHAVAPLAAFRKGDVQFEVFSIAEWSGEPHLANAEHTELRWVGPADLVELEVAHTEHLAPLASLLRGTWRGMAIETPRLLLRPFAAADVDSLYAIQGDRDAMRFTHWAESRVACESWLERYEALRPRLGFAPWTAVERAGSRIVGWGGLSVDPHAPGWGVEVSYFVDRARWGRGFAGELVRASLDHAFDALDLPEVGAFARPENAASIRVLEKAGFRLLRFEPALERNHYSARSGAADTRAVKTRP